MIQTFLSVIVIMLVINYNKAFKMLSTVEDREKLKYIMILVEFGKSLIFINESKLSKNDRSNFS